MRGLGLVGGGIKGYATILVLEALERLLGARLHERVDILGGTSVGSQIVCAIGAGMSMAHVLPQFALEGPDVFRSRGLARRWMRDIWRWGPSQPKYPSEPVEAALRRMFGDALLGDLRVPTVIPAYEATRPGFDAFRSWEQPWASMPIVSACLASSAAPVYFPAHVVRTPTGPRAWIDGGIAKNDPTLSMLAEMARLGQPLSAMRVVTVSAGDAPAPMDADDLREWGGVEWAPRFIPVSFHAQVDSDGFIARRFLEPENLVQIRIPLESGALDDASAENLASMRASVETYLASREGTAELRRAAALLAEA